MRINRDSVRGSVDGAWDPPEARVGIRARTSFSLAIP